MMKRMIGYVAFLLLAGCLYFFENGTATRIILGCSLLMPLVPALRGMFFAADRTEAKAPRPVAAPAFSRQEDGGPGNLRPYLPGDPVNRIHWKLSAKKDELLFREPDSAEEAGQTPAQREAAMNRAKSPKRQRVLWGLLLFFLFLLPLFLIPEASKSLQGLLNRLFALSEQRNAYVYDRFPVPTEQSVGWAAACLSAALAVFLCAGALAPSRGMLFAAWAGCALSQVYLGLPLPGWLNLMLFALFALALAARPLPPQKALTLLCAVLAVSLSVTLLWPGVDEAAEAASEKARDAISFAVERQAGVRAEVPEGEMETRHTHTQTLTDGENEAQTSRAYRLETVEEEQISRPPWIDYLRIVLLLLLAVALLVLPFLPFLLFNARRKKALEARRAFESENVSEAVGAIFQQVIRWLEITGNGGGNLPYPAWAEQAARALPPDAAARVPSCAEAFEKAAYSDHPLGEDQRAEALRLLDDTARALYPGADWKQKLRIRYKECLWP